MPSSCTLSEKFIDPTAPAHDVVRREAVNASPENTAEDILMTWTTPKIEEATCGMEINMYFPADDEGVLF